jgi:transposase
LIKSLAMAKPIVSDELWAAVEPLLPPEPEKPRGGRPRVPNRDCLRGIIFVLRTGLPWSWLPPEMGCGSGATCWRRLREWHEAGVWRRLHQVLLERLADADQLDWSRASVDSFAVPAPKGGRRPARIRRIAANRARSATLWSSAKASRSRSS